MESAGRGGGGWEASSQSLWLSSWLSVSSAALQTRHTARNPSWLFPGLIHHVNEFSRLSMCELWFLVSVIHIRWLILLGQQPDRSRTKQQSRSQMSPVTPLMFDVRPSGDGLFVILGISSSPSALMWWRDPSAVPNRTSWWKCRSSAGQVTNWISQTDEV